MDLTDTSVEELRRILGQDFGEPFTMDQARDAARRLMTFYEGYVKWLSTQEPPPMLPDVPLPPSEGSTAQGG
jgi:hypothetical protein